MKRRELLKELKALSDTDLKERARSIQEELMKLRFRAASGQLEKSHRMRELRRTLARVKTFYKSKSISA